MTTDIINVLNGEKFPFTNVAWEEVLNIALKEGWQPSGTCFYKNSKKDFEWNSSDYTTNQGQLIETKDAHALGYALKIGIAKFENINKINEKYDSRILSINRIQKFIDEFCFYKNVKLQIY